MVGKLICQHVLLSVIELKCRQHEAELRQSREECWAREQELAASREKLAHLKTTLEDRRKDMVGYKVTAHAVSSICGHVTSPQIRNEEVLFFRQVRGAGVRPPAKETHMFLLTRPGKICVYNQNLWSTVS